MSMPEDKTPLGTMGLGVGNFVGSPPSRQILPQAPYLTSLSFRDLFMFWILASGFQAAVIWFTLWMFGAR